VGGISIDSETGSGIILFIRETGRASPKIDVGAGSFTGMEVPVVSAIINLCAFLLGIVGAALIIYGGFRAFVRVILLELTRPSFTYNQIRRDFTDKIVFGLEFLIAADILATLLSPTEQDLINLAVVVVIRTILGYFLSKEAAEFSLQ
jgi:uncharacterized membrane protein